MSRARLLASRRGRIGKSAAGGTTPPTGNPNPKATEHLTDDFATLNATRWSVWNDNSANPSVVAGRMRVPSSNVTNANPGYAGAETAAAHMLFGSSIVVEVPVVPANPGTGTEVYCSLKLVSPTFTSTAGDTSIEIMYDRVTNVLRFHSVANWTWDAGEVTLAYNATTHRWWKIELLSSGTNPLRFHTSPDGTTWTQRRAMAAPTWLTDVATREQITVALEAGRSGTGTDGFAEFDNLNLPPGSGGGTPPPETLTVNAGADTSVAYGATFSRTATVTGGTPLDQHWNIVSGPVGAGPVIDSDATLAHVFGSTPSGSNDIRHPVFQEMPFQFTSTAENSTTAWTGKYSYIEDILDGRGGTGGLVGFTTATGDMLPMIQDYVNRKPTNNVLSKHIAGLQACANFGDTVDQAEYGVDGGGASDIYNTELKSKGFETDWATAANTDPLFRQVQRDWRQSMYWGPALTAAREDGLSALGLLIYYDTIVNHGPGVADSVLRPATNGSFDNIRAATKASNTTPANGGAERAFLVAFKNNRSTVLTNWGDNPSDGRIAAITSLLPTTPNFSLTGTVSWNMYGEAFSFNRPNPPSDSVIGTYVLEFAAATATATATDQVTVTVT